jgi:hypothetical protein
MWLSNDYLYAALGFICDISLLSRFGVWQVPVLQVATYLCKVLQLWSNAKWLSQPVCSHRSWLRNGLIVIERALRVTCLLYITTCPVASNIVMAPQKQEPQAAIAALLYSINTLIISSGCFAALWHSILIPVPWVLELPLLLPLLWAALRYRIPSTMTVFQGSSVVVRRLERVIISACSLSCSMVTSIQHGSQHMCAFQAPGAHQQLAATLNLFLVFILPLYIR